jgi:hypothetical protein
MNPTINLGKISIDAYKFAVNANAILGTRNAGKTYTGKYIAESLIDINIPIIFLDPVGRARYMQQANPNNPNGKSYPVIVVGKNADVELSLDTIESVIMMALETRSSLIIDLYDKDFDETKDEIVAKICETLYFQNEKYGLRTLIVEESADFLGQTSKKTIASTWLTKLTRYSGNFKLGVVFINQNAESLSKEVLKLCKGMLIGIQNETNSIKMIRKWLAGGGVKNSDEISETLPNLTSGQFWVWATYLESNVPVLTKIPMIRSNHPSREDIGIEDVLPSESTMSVIEKMNNITTAESVEITESEIFGYITQKFGQSEDSGIEINIDENSLGFADMRTLLSARTTGYGSGTVEETVNTLVKNGYTIYNDVFGYLQSENTSKTFVLNSSVEKTYAKLAIQNLVRQNT